jgi:hypothetical protein
MQGKRWRGGGSRCERKQRRRDQVSQHGLGGTESPGSLHVYDGIESCCGGKRGDSSVSDENAREDRPTFLLTRGSEADKAT